MSKLNTNDKQKLNTIYVFSENNKVYIKSNTCTKVTDNSSVTNEEWFPINFQWRNINKTKKEHETSYSI